jgi:hypothetical protein
MEEQYKDLAEFFESDPGEPPPTHLDDASVLIPHTALAPERTLFLDELAFVLALLDKE